MKDLEFHRRVSELLTCAQPFAVAEIVETVGSCPQAVGSKMIVHGDGRCEGTIGGGPFEALVIEAAGQLIPEGKAALKEYTFSPETTGMYCAGKAKVYIRTYLPGSQLLIFGGGHVGEALGRLAAETGLFFITLVDDRSEYADPRRHPRAHRVVRTDREYSEGIPPIGKEGYVVIATRCHDVDRKLLERWVTKNLSYLGMIGSESKKGRLFQELSRDGVSQEALERVRTPIGLPIGGKSPEEIAVSILAEIIQVRNESG